MPTAVSNGLRRVAARLTPDPTPDGELLARFLSHRDETAFAVLVRRHAAMVFGTCRRVLGNAADADDAFQAAFVVLVRKAHSLTDRACVGNFLYGVAFHTALKAKAMAAKRRTREAGVKRLEPREDQSELLAALDTELARLPDKYREPVVMCELEGRSRREAAKALGVPEGTLSSRLATAHRMLEKRLRARGFGAVCVAAVLAAQAHAATNVLTDAAVRAASAEPTKGVLQLVSEVTKMMLLQKLGIGTAVLAVAALVVGVALAVPRGTDEKPAAKAEAKPVRAIATAPADEEPAWKAEFRRIYGLKEGEFVHRVAPPYTECRAEYFKDMWRELFKQDKREAPADVLNRDYTSHVTKFAWKDNWVVQGLNNQRYMGDRPDEGIPLVQMLDITMGFNRTHIDADEEVLETKVTGDWVVRVGADSEKLATAIEAILRKECNLSLSLAVQEAERETYVLSGRFTSKPLADRKENHIEIYARELTSQDDGWGGSGTLLEMTYYLEDWIKAPVVLGKIEGTPKRVSWHASYRVPFTEKEAAEDRDPEAVMKNIAAQSGLTVKREKRPVKVLVVKKAPG